MIGVKPSAPPRTVEEAKARLAAKSPVAA
jgi:hypothetical protein